MDANPSFRSSQPPPGSWVAALTSNLPPTQPDTKSSPDQPPKVRPPSERLSDQVYMLRHQLDSARKQVRNLKTEHVQEREKSRTEVTKLEKSLIETRTKLVRLLPEEGPSEDHIKHAFEDLCENIEALVDIECGNLDDLKARIETDAWTERDLQVLGRHVTDDDLDLAQNYPEISTQIVICAIFSIVFEMSLVDGRWMLGMSKEEELSLENIASHIPTMNGNIAQRRWRRETYLALCGQQSRIDEQKLEARSVAKVLSSFVNHFRNHGKGNVSERKVQEKIVGQALKLAEMCKTSMTKYILHFPTNSSSKNNVLCGEEASSYTFVDAKTGTEVKADKVQPGGKLRLCVFPALLKVLESGETRRMVSAMVVLEQ